MLIPFLLTFFVLAVAKLECPATVADELELIAQPLDCFKQLYNPKDFDNSRMQRIVNERIQAYQRMLQELSMSGKQHFHTAPVVKWAQSNAQIFISFKLSHRQDSPTCSDIRSQFFTTSQIAQTKGDVQFQSTTNSSLNVSEFSYKGECFFTTQKLWFNLAIKFQGKLSRLMIRKQGLGLYALIGDKAEPMIWVQPFTDYKKAAIWVQLRNKYSQDMDKYFSQAESFSDQKKEVKRRHRKRPKANAQGDL